MWRSYCERLKQRSGMGALRSESVLYDPVIRSQHYFQPQPKRTLEQLVLIPESFSTEAVDAEIGSSVQTQIIWSPLYDGEDVKGCSSVGSLPAGWRTAEQKLLEMRSLERANSAGDLLLASSISNSEEDEEPVMASAKCLLRMQDIVDSPAADRSCRIGSAGDDFLEFSRCDLGVSAIDSGSDKQNQKTSCRNIIVQDFMEMEKPKTYYSEFSMEDSKYHSCSGGDGSVCSLRSSTVIGRGRMHCANHNVEHPSLNGSRGSTVGGGAYNRREHGSSKPRSRLPAEGHSHEPPQLVKNADVKKVKRSSKVAGSRMGPARPWNAAPNRKESDRKPENSSSLSQKQRSKHPSQRRLPDSEAASVASTADGCAFDQTQQQHQSLGASFAEMNLRELRALQCTTAAMRHNIGALEDDVKKLQNWLERKNVLRYSWWSLVKDFMVAAGIVTGTFALRTIVSMLRRNAVNRTLKKITDKQEKMALAAFLLTVGARFGKQLWHDKWQGKTVRASVVDVRLQEQLCRIKDRVLLMSHLASSSAAAAGILPPAADSE